MSRRQLQYGLAVVWVALYAYLLVVYLGRGHLSWWTVPVIVASLYVADLAGGIAHFTLDYTPNVSGVGLYELYHFKGNKGGKKYVRMRAVAMKKISAFHELVFDFKVHHLSPLALGRRPFSQMTLPIVVFADLPITLVLVVLGEFELIPPDVSLFMLVFLGAATVSQYAHSCNHKPDAPWAIRALQRVGLLITDEGHDTHHQHPDRWFCLLNGWANPVVDALFRLSLRLGIFKPDGLDVIR